MFFLTCIKIVWFLFPWTDSQHLLHVFKIAPDEKGGGLNACPPHFPVVGLQIGFEHGSGREGKGVGVEGSCGVMWEGSGREDSVGFYQLRQKCEHTLGSAVEKLLS